MSSRNRVAQIYPWAMGGSLSVAYDYQGYGGGILSRLHTRSDTRPNTKKNTYEEQDINYQRELKEPLQNCICIRLCIYVNA
jgi:hypothetical protein